MTFTKFQFNNFCYWPSNPKKIVEFIFEIMFFLTK